LHIREIVIVNGVPKRIIFDKVLRFTSRLWQTLQEVMGTPFETKFNLSFPNR